MPIADLRGQVALITGGTRGLGAAAGLAFARAGAHVVLTHRWGSASEAEVAAPYRAAGCAPPLLVEADVGDAGDVTRVIETIATTFGRLDLFVSNVCVAARGDGFAGLRKRDLASTMQRSAWALPAHLDAIESRLGALPRITIAMSSDGAEHFYPGYDYVAMAKAALESLVGTLAPRIARDGGRIFGLRTRQVDTASFAAMFEPTVRALLLSRLRFFLVDAAEMGEAALALALGGFDGLHGDVLTADRGAGFFDSFVAVAPLLQPGSLRAESGDDTPVAATGGALVVPLFDVMVSSPQAAADEAFRLVETMRAYRDAHGTLPRHTVVTEARGSDDHSAAGRAVLRTQVRYLTSNLMFAPVCLNLVRHEPTPTGRARAAATVAALCSGRLDHVRGQVLELHDH
jgi:NAD(P)-dependent dehydrogenase (short-subunit alcohol dehydrogenase family)